MTCLAAQKHMSIRAERWVKTSMLNFLQIFQRAGEVPAQGFTGLGIAAFFQQVQDAQVLLAVLGSAGKTFRGMCISIDRQL